MYTSGEPERMLATEASLSSAITPTTVKRTLFRQMVSPMGFTP